MAATAASLLNVDVAHVLLSGWRVHRALMGAARATASAPKTVQIVDLATHTVSSVHEPTLDVQVDHRTVCTLHFELTIEIAVQAMAAKVQAGRLVEIRSGKTEVTAELKCEGVEIAKNTAKVNLQLHIPLGHGILLVQPPPQPPQAPGRYVAGGPNAR